MMAYVSAKPTQRQLKKMKGTILAERHFLVEWVEDDAHSIVSSKQVMHDAPMSLARGDAIDVKLKGSTYQAAIVGVGTKSEMERLQSQYSDSDEESLDSEATHSDMSAEGKKSSEKASEESTEKGSVGEMSDSADEKGDQDSSCQGNSSSEGSTSCTKSTSATPSSRKRSSPTKPPAPKRLALNNPEKSPAKKTKKKATSPAKKKSPTKRSPPRRRTPTKSAKNKKSPAKGTGAKGVPSGSKARDEHPEAKSAHKEALQKKKTKEKERQSYLVESSSEILAQAEEGLEATNHTDEQHKDARDDDLNTNCLYSIDDDGFTPNDLHISANGDPQFTPPSQLPLRKSHSDPTLKSYSQPSIFSSEYNSGYTPMPHLPTPPPTAHFPFMYSRSSTPMSEHSSSYLSSTYGYGRDHPEIMSTLRTLREDFNRLVGEVESLKTEVRKKARKASKDMYRSVKPPPDNFPEGVEGCWFGVKGDDKLGVFIPGVKQCDLSAVDVCTSAGNLSQDLLELLFSKEEMAQGCATKPRRGDIQKLDNHRLHAIRVHLAHRFPAGPLYGPDESKRWKDIKGKKINVRCRQYRPTKQDTS